MDNPLDRERRIDNPLADAEDLARDLAYGALYGQWEAYIDSDKRGDWITPFNRKSGVTSDQEKFLQKWWDIDNMPGFDLLASLDYLTILKDHRALPTGGSVEISYKLTGKAFDLLQKPGISPKIFISYRRRESSALALLIEARLRLAGADPDRIFIDRNIPGGADWGRMIKEKSENCDYFVLLMGPTSFDSEYVRQEFEWAFAQKRAIIPICHNGHTLVDCDERVNKYHGFSIESDNPSAMQYESAVNFVLNSIGYRTY